MVLNALYGWYQRNIYKLSTYNKRKEIEQLELIINRIKEEIRNSKNKGGTQYVNG
ncbi:hypothetical protein [Peribacillus loiseleuriae]|uniref:hypothetical protein n=1 Tax=Peribacillus loiseleuriae TaxID=1679170 RepID=UPI000B31F2FB|nr:hypothetical protein [Peribacillus loiseleuriae]